MKGLLARYACLALALTACDRPNTPAAVKPGEDVLATVNGVPIRQLDVTVRMQRRGAKGSGGADPAAVLETVIREELTAQRAVALGLDRDPAYQARVQRSEAELAGLRREALGELFQQKEIAAKAVVADDEARRYFDEHAKRIRTTVRVGQILRRSEQEIEQIRAKVANGEPFEAVAEAGLPPLPEGTRKPWDLGMLRWEQLPPEWEPVLAKLEPGQASGVIRGAGGRFWVIKLFDRREDPAITFESAKGAIKARLQAQKTLTMAQDAERALQQGARIVRHRAPAALHPGTDDE